MAKILENKALSMTKILERKALFMTKYKRVRRYP